MKGLKSVLAGAVLVLAGSVAAGGRILGRLALRPDAPPLAAAWRARNVPDLPTLRGLLDGEAVCDGEGVTPLVFTRYGQELELHLSSAGDRAKVRVRPSFKTPVCVDLTDGSVREIPVGATEVETRLPALIANRTAIPLVIDWKTATPFEIVDSIYRPGQFAHHMKGFPGPHSNATWLALSNDEFLPCFDRYGQFRHRTWPGKTESDADLRRSAAEEASDLTAHAGPTDRTRFGGWKNGPRFEATGRFYAKKVDGKWWLVDPEGCLFWSFGPVRVSASSGMTPMNGDSTTPRTGFARPDRDCFFAELPPAPDAPDATPFSRFWTTHDDLLWPFYLARGETRVFDFSSANLYRKYGADYYDVFADLVHRRLKSWGCTTIGNSSDLKICLMDRTPYAERVETLSRPIAASWGAWGKFRDPWDPSFKPGITAALEAHGREAHDPWCIGFFIDNEIQWGAKPTDLARWTLLSPDDQPAKVVFLKWLAEKGVDPRRGDAVSDGDLAAFTRVIVEEYFTRTREAVKAFDKDLLYLGCRFAGRARDWVIDACARHCDVISYNIYDEELQVWKLPHDIDAPVLVGEFHFGASDRGPFGRGVCVAKDQQERAARMKRYVRRALAHPQIVGAHWHQFSDQAASGRFDGECLQVGWTDICDTPYPIMRAALREVAYPLYEMRLKSVPSPR